MTGDTLLQRLRTSYGLGQKVINCMVYVVPQRPNTTSSHSDVQFDAIGSRLWNPARVGLGPILFLLYTADLLQLVKGHHLTPHAYADDTQIYGHCQPSDAGGLAQPVTASARFQRG